MTEYEMLRESAKELVKYYLIQNGDVAYADLEKVSIVYYKNSEGNLTSYQNAHFCVRYAKTDGTLVEKYFDYVTCDKQGQTMLKADKDDSTPDYTKNYGGINLLIKMPTYKIANNESTTEFMYVTDADYKAMSSADRAIYSKSATFNGVKYHYNARVGWVETDPVAVKGTDIYTRAQYTADIQNLKNLPEEISSLKNIINQLESDITDKQTLVESYQNAIDTYTQELSNETAARTALEQAKADFETQKQNLESEIATINVVIGGLQNDVNLLTEQKTQLENEIIQHNNSIAEYQTQLDAKVAEIAALEKRLNEFLSMKPGEITNDVPVVSNQAANDASSALASETALESEVEDAVAPSETVSIIDLLKQQPVIDYDDEEVEDDIISTLETEATTEAAVGENPFVPIQQQATISNEVVETESIEDARVPLTVNLENTEKSTTKVDSEVPLANDMIAPRLQW